MCLLCFFVARSFLCFLWLVLLLRIVALAGANADVAARGHRDLNSSKLCRGRIRIAVVLEQILPAQLSRDLAENSFEILIRIRNERRAAGRFGNCFHPSLSTHRNQIQLYGWTTRVHRVEDHICLLNSFLN